MQKEKINNSFETLDKLKNINNFKIFIFWLKYTFCFRKYTNICG